MVPDIVDDFIYGLDVMIVWVCSRHKELGCKVWKWRIATSYISGGTEYRQTIANKNYPDPAKH